MKDFNFIPTTASGCQPNTEQPTLEIESPTEAEREKNWLENAIPMDCSQRIQAT